MVDIFRKVDVEAAGFCEEFLVQLGIFPLGFPSVCLITSQLVSEENL